MTLGFPDRISLHKTIAVATTLAAVQLLEHTSLQFALLFFAFSILSVFAFNYAGGFSHASGAFVFWFSLLVVDVGVFGKILFGEPGNSNMFAPTLTMTAYVATMVSIFLALVISSKLTGKNRGVALSLGANRVNLRLSSLGCYALGITLQVIDWLYPAAPGSILSAVNQLNYFLPLGIILATIHNLRVTNGRRSVDAITLTVMISLTVLGISVFSKQLMFVPFAAWFLAATYMRMRLTAIRIAVLIASGIVAAYLMAPLAGGRIYVTEDMTISDRLALAKSLLANLQQVKQESAEQQIASTDTGATAGYYNQPEGFLDRLSMIPEDDQLIEYTSHGHLLGYQALADAFLNWVPNFIIKKGPTSANGGGNFYAHELGYLATDDITTGISFSATGEAFHLGGWQGVLLVAPIIFMFLFVSYDLVEGDLRTHPWGVLVIFHFAHQVPETGLLGPIYLVFFGNIAFLFSMFICIYITPIVGAALSGRHQFQTHELDQAVA